MKEYVLWMKPNHDDFCWKKSIWRKAGEHLVLLHSVVWEHEESSDCVFDSFLVKHDEEFSRFNYGEKVLMRGGMNDKFLMKNGWKLNIAD
jgi:hypothetical protein